MGRQTGTCTYYLSVVSHLTWEYFAHAPHASQTMGLSPQAFSPMTMKESIDENHPTWVIEDNFAHVYGDITLTPSSLCMSDYHGKLTISKYYWWTFGWVKKPLRFHVAVFRVALATQINLTKARPLFFHSQRGYDNSIPMTDCVQC